LPKCIQCHLGWQISRLVKVLHLFFLLAISGLGTISYLCGQDLTLSDKADQNSENLEIHADVTDFDEATGMARASGDVIIKLGDVTIEAEEAEFSQKSGIIRATGKVRLFKGRQVFNAEEIFYHTESGEVTASHIKSALEPFYYQTDKIVIPKESGAPITMENATLTTHDSPNPDYRVTAKKLTIYPENKVVMRGARVKVGDTNVFGFPYYVQPLNSELGFMTTPGWSSAWGGYLLNRYGFMLGDDYLAHANLDYRSERGVAGGLEIWDKKFDGNPAIGRLKLYYANDQNPQIRFNGTNRADGVSEDRYRINLQHRVYLPSDNDDKTLYLDFDVNKLSDAFMYEDFFPRDFRIDPQPDNLVNLTKLFDQGEATFLNRFDANDFFQTDSRNEVAVDIIRTPIGGTGFFYDGFTSYGILDEHLGDDSGVFADPLTGYNRFATYHEVLMPHTYNGWLNVVPRAGIGYANYSDFDIAGLDSVDRAIYHGGVDLSFKLSKRNEDIYNKMLGIDGLMHVVQPYLNYSVIGAREINGRFSAIDRYTPTTRLRPIDMPMFTAFDSLGNMNLVRSGVSNKWYTRRNGGSAEWLSIDNYMDTYFEDPEFDRQFSNFFTEVRWSPVSWFNLNTTAQVPLFDKSLDFTEINTRANFMLTDWFRFGVGHYYLNGHPFFQNADLITLNTYTRLGEEWGFSTAHRYEADDGVLEYQQYALHKDIGSWVASVGGTIRDNRITDPEYGMFLSLTLKAFPKIRIPVDFDPGSSY
jgi:LPS-assembly protein